MKLTLALDLEIGHGSEDLINSTSSHGNKSLTIVSNLPIDNLMGKEHKLERTSRL
jgi:hypothetical protein